ncbi:MAG TPA: VTT domain-containing protein [Thermodesulfobacteriota bacterium]|nr:VTT domain-containing protein [Thermodesulfobacteriota bacterium]
MNQDSLFIEGRTCWRKRKAERAAVLIDGADYFSAFVEAVDRAQKLILISGWDIDSRVPLLRSTVEERTRTQLGDFLNRKAARTPDLHIYILVWDFAMIYALDRELLPVFKLGWRTHRRIHFHMDSHHPFGASHHQKIVVVDDRIAFCGGLDFTKRRWDTTEHRIDDPRRWDLSFPPVYKPFHDVQLLVDHEAAASLGELFRERWKSATGKRIDIARATRQSTDPWPTSVSPHLTDVDVAIARTVPPMDGRPSIREVEALFRDSILAAQSYIYIENQYLTSSIIAQALAQQLSRRQGPEIILVAPLNTTGWLAEGGMTALRALVLKKLYAADHHHRLRVYYPMVQDSKEHPILVHAKVMIMDDTFIRVGSSNLSNRSMAIDTECDLAVEAGSNKSTRVAIAHLRDLFISEHLGVSPEECGQRISRFASVIAAVESMQNSHRTLKPLPDQLPEVPQTFELSFLLLDPEKPVAPEQLVASLLPKESRKMKIWQVMKPVGFLTIVAGAIVAWRWSFLGEYMSVDVFLGWAHDLQISRLTPALIIALYTAGTAFLVPLIVLTTMTLILLDPLTGFVCAFAGSLSGAIVTYTLGYLLGRGRVRRLAGTQVNRLSRYLTRRGITAVILARNLPTVSYTIVNMAAGASRFSFRDYLLGTAFGILPGLSALTLFVNCLKSFMVEPQPFSFIFLLALVILFITAGIWTHRRFFHPHLQPEVINGPGSKMYD